MQEQLSTIDLRSWLEQKAKDCERRGRYKQAISYWGKLLQRMTRLSRRGGVDVDDLAALHYRLGMAHRALRDPMKSIHHFKVSIRLNSSEPRYYQAFGRAVISGGHWQVARVQFEKALKLDPKNDVYWRQYAWILSMLGRKDEARVCAKKAYLLNRKSSQNQWVLIRVFMESRMYLHALSMLRKLPLRPKTKRLIEQCKAEIAQTFEGGVLKAILKGMRLDGRPFDIFHYRRAEELWVEFCFSRPYLSQSQISPEAWAAAVVWLLTFELPSLAEVTLDDLLNHFQVDSQQVWPALKRLQPFWREREEDAHSAAH